MLQLPKNIEIQQLVDILFECYDGLPEVWSMKMVIEKIKINGNSNQIFVYVGSACNSVINYPSEVISLYMKLSSDFTVDQIQDCMLAGQSLNLYRYVKDVL